MDKIQQKNMKKIIIGFCALVALAPLTAITVGLHKNNPAMVKLGFAGSVLMGIGIGMIDFKNLKNHEKKRD